MYDQPTLEELKQKYADSLWVETYGIGVREARNSFDPPDEFDSLMQLPREKEFVVELHTRGGASFNIRVLGAPQMLLMSKPQKGLVMFDTLLGIDAERVSMAVVYDHAFIDSSPKGISENHSGELPEPST